MDVRTLHEVTEIDPGGGWVRYRSVETGSEEWEHFDELLIGAGARPICPEVPGDDLRGIYGICGLALRRAIEDEKPRRAVVVGGGYIGLVMAEALVRRDLKVSLVDRGPEVMATLDPDMGRLEKVGVEVRRGERVEGIRGERRED